MSKKHNISDHSECFAEDILIKYINDELSLEESDAVEKHLSGCEICSDFVDGVLEEFEKQSNEDIHNS